jgi:hypothetical protein
METKRKNEARIEIKGLMIKWFNILTGMQHKEGTMPTTNTTLLKCCRVNNSV